jgi:hypothetical protein
VASSKNLTRGEARSIIRALEQLTEQIGSLDPVAFFTAYITEISSGYDPNLGWEIPLKEFVMPQQGGG